MYKTILILEESTLVHNLFESALPKENWNWNVEHEQRPGRYISKAKSIQPDIIFLSNNDQKEGYTAVKGLQNDSALKDAPIILLTSAKDKIDEDHLQQIGVSGFLRKPFESTTLQDQLETIFEDQKQNRTKNRKHVLDSIQVIDDELLDILSDKKDNKISIDQLEDELDITSQLVGDDVLDLPEEDIKEDDTVYDLVQTEEDYEETELVELENIESDDEDIDDGEFGDNSEFELNIEDDADVNADFVELDYHDTLPDDGIEPIDSDESGENFSKPTGVIEVLIEDLDNDSSRLTNTGDETERQYIELNVGDIESDSEPISFSDNSQKEYTELSVEESTDSVNTTHANGEYTGSGGISEISLEIEDDDSDNLGDIVQENLEVEFSNFGQSESISTDLSVSDHINVDFDEEIEDLSEFEGDSLSEFEIDENMEDEQLDHDSFEIETEDSIEDISRETEPSGEGFNLDLLLDDDQNNAAANIQQMINLRQVSKAKYDVLQDDNQDVDLENTDNDVDFEESFDEIELPAENESLDLSDEAFNSESASDVELIETDLMDETILPEDDTIQDVESSENQHIEEGESLFEDIDNDEVAFDTDEAMDDISLNLGDDLEMLTEDLDSDAVLPDISLEEASDVEVESDLDLNDSTSLMDEIELSDESDNVDQGLDINLNDDTSLEENLDLSAAAIDGDEIFSEIPIEDETIFSEPDITNESDQNIGLDSEEASEEDIFLEVDLDLNASSEKEVLTDLSLSDEPEEELSLDSDLDLDTSSEDDMLSDLSLPDEPEEELSLDSDLDLDTSSADDMLSDLSLPDEPEEELSLDSDLDLDTLAEDDMLSDLSLSDEPEEELLLDSDLDLDTSSADDMLSDLTLPDEPEEELSLDSDLDLDVSSEDDMLSDLSLPDEPEEETSFDSDLDLDVSSEDDMLSDMSLSDESEDEISLEIDLDTSSEDDIMSDFSDVEVGDELEIEGLELDLDANSEAVDEMETAQSEVLINTEDDKIEALPEFDIDESVAEIQENIDNENLENEEVLNFEASDDDILNDQLNALGSTMEAEKLENQNVDTPESRLDENDDLMEKVENADDMMLQISSDVFEIGDLKLKSVAADDELPSNQNEIISEIDQQENETDDKLIESKLISDSNRKALKTLSGEHREELGAILESVISDTLQSALNKVLPEMMEKIIQEELKD